MELPLQGRHRGLVVHVLLSWTTPTTHPVHVGSCSERTRRLGPGSLLRNHKPAGTYPTPAGTRRHAHPNPPRVVRGEAWVTGLDGFFFPVRPETLRSHCLAPEAYDAPVKGAMVAPSHPQYAPPDDRATTPLVTVFRESFRASPSGGCPTKGQPNVRRVTTLSKLHQPHHTPDASSG